MAYNFLGLINDVNRRLNEVELTTTTFNTAIGEYSMIKDVINASIRYINQHEFEWPFNHETENETVTVGTVRYDFPSNAKSVDMNTFRIERNSTLGNQTKKLKVIRYNEYLEKYVDNEYNTSTVVQGMPHSVVRTPSEEFALVPSPDKAYTVTYEYYKIPSDLTTATSVPTLPEQFRYVIIDGAMYNAYLFRGESQEAAMMQQRFEQGIKQMRTIYINRYEYVNSTMLTRSAYASNTRVN
ncbi:MAG: hypothetical protein CBC83_02345 [Flavobacteriales bacterium TMED123]|nr:hypothetical protein [Candidatus Neomarinimicrobiota bacterium]MAJ44522.1 hypothetical protein [Candidatus Neomarinimicrobiota bacterium]OUV73958.1 MAG: hypothetical protein CBC83_04790 [Flavobacteriales bacterium TMED123]OUV75599.1 MAG: hypothetical protein CBC83_02345 [Flavobacteriales bacterium TMED123]|tara:strand:+ start:4675 stop:5394 length:720 start_codon:yes stop_codon:yes gene_type:complete